MTDPLYELGFNAAGANNNNTAPISAQLEPVFGRCVEEWNQGKNNKEAQLEGLYEEVRKLRQDIHTQQAQQQNLSRELPPAEEKVEDLRRQKNKIQDNPLPATDPIPFFIGAFITIVLTLYLYIFYASTGYSAFKEISPHIVTGIPLDGLQRAMRDFNGSTMLFLFFPILLLALGYLIHDSIEKNKTARLEGKSASYWMIGVLLAVTLLADAIIGYKISKAVYINGLNQGLTDRPWNVYMAIEDVNFWLVLIMGFAAYIIWGFMLNRTLSHPYLAPDDQLRQRETERVEEQITGARRHVQKLHQDIAALESGRRQLEDTITDKEKRITRLQNGTVNFDHNRLRELAGQFQNGYVAWITARYPSGDESDSYINDTVSAINQWIDSKILETGEKIAIVPPIMHTTPPTHPQSVRMQEA